MGAPSLVHETFAVEIFVEAAPSRVFTAYADVRLREQWSAPAGDAIVYDTSDFRTGGTDAFRCGPKDNLRFHGAVVYQEIAANDRFVFFESIRTGDQMLSVSIVTWELFAEANGTRVRSTTQMVSFIGRDMIAGAKSGTRAAMKNLVGWLSHAARPQ